MFDKRTIQSAAFGLLLVNLTQGIDWGNSQYLSIVFAIFYASLGTILTCYILSRKRILDANDQKEIIIETDDFKELISTSRYDFRHLKQNMLVYLGGTTIVFVLYVGFNAVQALIMHSVFSIGLIATDPIFKIHVFKQRGVGELARPFGSAPLFQEKRVEEVKSIEELDTNLKKAGKKLVMIDFYAEWCRPCRNIAPEVEELAATFDNVCFYRVDVDKSNELASKYGVSKVPHFIFFKEKQVVSEVVGATKNKLSNAILEHTGRK
eukprot:CAMPEP_0184737334 /NCGR_PEP_ID=MMETSP0315-20130426/134_1 /TAXON_ID=101924 /ORGANISM="Rhodosorus marinus, Strain UTEX LB 2760" /LENGTH=264 /DNA_ID=CAMNT_0027204485 /DNA_START=521 /DNA_END=1315 /DNA_ORIENTATION=+